MAAETINLGHVDEVWMIPCGHRTDKHLMTDGNMRLQMTRLLVSEFFKDNFPVKVTTYL